VGTLRPTLLVLLGWLQCAIPASSLVADAGGFAQCAQRFAAHPQEREAASCFFVEATRSGAREEGSRWLRRLLTDYSHNPGLEFNLAKLEPAPERAEKLFRAAAGEFLPRDPEGEFAARYNLVERLLSQGLVDEAGLEVERLAAAARAFGAQLRTRYTALAKISRARWLISSGDLRQAGLLLDEVPPGPLRNQLWLAPASTAHIETGQLERAWDECMQLSQLAISHYDQASGFYCQARVLVERMAELPADANRNEIHKVVRRAIVEAESGNNWTVAARAHWLLAMLSQGGEQLKVELQRCLDVAHGDSDKRLCLRAFGRYQASVGKAPSREPAGAVRGLDLDDPIARAQGWGDQMRVSWRTRSFEEFIRDAQRGLSEIERLRAKQADSAVQAGLFSTWSDDYYWFSGRLLETALAKRCPSCVDLAFGVVEGLRARTLHDILVAAGVEVGAAPPNTAPLVALRVAIERVAKRRSDGSLPLQERTYAQSDLFALTAKENQLRHHAAPGLAAPTGSTNAALPAAPSIAFASLPAVQAMLAPDEALLSFQIAPWQDWTGDFGGGSWLVVATRTARRCYRLGEMGRSDLRNGVADLFEHRSQPRSWQATELYRRLLGPALDELPAGVKRLIVVPDDHLHRLPFAALRATPTSEPLAWRYQISIVPSATLWAHWRRAPKPPPVDRPALVLADPRPPTPDAQKTFQAAGITVPNERLPAARREADAVVRFLGRGCERRVDGAVSEAAILDQRLTLRRFALVHFAVHSIVDDRDPSRSGIWLSPSPGHDGLLQAAEITKLGFDGRLVVLSTCSSNGGPFLRGEGVMSLAHAFFQARARTVVASLWPQLDTDAEALLTGFYRHLSQGASVAAALRLAQLDLLRQNPLLPPAAWAGMVVLGDGELVPFPGGQRPWTLRWLLAAATAALLLFVVAVLAMRARHGRSAREPQSWFHS
jgi:CHAT domain-containing protein